jgi:DNA-binding transcriptional LysR family regulator
VVTHDEPTIQEIARRPLHIEPLVEHRLALICAADSPWSRELRRLPKAGVRAAALVDFPLILPEPDSGVRRGLDEVLHRQGVLGRLTIALEIGGWAAILAYVRDGFGVGIVSTGALVETKALTVRTLHPEEFPSIQARLICRRLAGSGPELDLSEPAQEWRAALREVAGRQGGSQV